MHPLTRLVNRCTSTFSLLTSSRTKLSGLGVVASLALAASALPATHGQDLVLVENGKSLAPIIVSEPMPAKVEPMLGEYGETPTSFRAEIRASAEELADYIEKVSGARPQIIEGAPASIPAKAIWVGYQPALDSLFPNIDFDFKHPEEIVVAANANHLVIAGRDRGPEEVAMVDGLFDHFRKDVIAAHNCEEGTANAVSTFLQKHLGVRWLWPGELGEDVTKSPAIKFAPFEYRFHPPIRARMFAMNPRGKPPEIKQWWENRQRAGRRGSQWLPINHSEEDWWDKYHEAHPDWFAMQPDGTRKPPARPKTVKLCLSNPEVAQQWLIEAEAKLRANPQLKVLRMVPTDGGGWCVCDNCKAWDHPAGGGSLTERHVKFWNILARGLKERFPDRDVMLDEFAYSVYSAPPIATRVEDNIAIRYVGHFPLGDSRDRAKAKNAMKQWIAMGAKEIGYRPNGWWYDGGFWGMPAVELEKTAEDFRFLAEIGSNGFQFDSVQMYFATLAPQNYAFVQLAYDPMQDGAALMDDFFARGFGPGASDVQQYFKLMQQVHHELVESEGWRAASGARRTVPAKLAAICTPGVLAQAQTYLDAAKSNTAGGSELYQKRVAFVQAGLDFVKLQMELIPVMETVRTSGGKDKAAVDKAVSLAAARDELMKNAPPFAFDIERFQNSVLKSMDMQDYLGPPSEQFLKAQAEAAAATATQTQPLAVAERWKVKFVDEFKRAELGPDWKAVAGDWRIRNGALVASAEGAGSILMSTRKFPGLHRVEVEMAAMPTGVTPANAAQKADQVGDLSIVIQTSAEDFEKGYFLQFGGRMNKLNSLLRAGSAVLTTHDVRIVPGRFYRLVAEFDGNQVRLRVDGKVVLEYKEAYPLVGAGQEAVALYVHSPTVVRSVRVSTAEARAKDRWDDPDME